MHDIITTPEILTGLTWIGGWLIASAAVARHAELMRKLEAMADALRERRSGQ